MLESAYGDPMCLLVGGGGGGVAVLVRDGLKEIFTFHL